MAQQTVTLQPGESKLVSFEAVPHEVKAYQVAVDGLSGSFNVAAPPPSARVVAIEWRDAQPFPPNQSQRLTIRMQNLASYPYTYTLDIFNDGVWVSAAQLAFSAEQTIEHSLNIALGGVGTHSLAARLSYGTTILDEKYSAYIVAEVEAEKNGEIGEWLIWYEGLSQWQDFSSGITIPANTEVHVLCVWRNLSEISARGHVDLLLIVPPGYPQSLSATHNQDKSAPPGDGWYVQFEPFVTATTGDYKLRAWLTVDDTLIPGVSERQFSVG